MTSLQYQLWPTMSSTPRSHTRHSRSNYNVRSQDGQYHEFAHRQFACSTPYLNSNQANSLTRNVEWKPRNSQHIETPCDVKRHDKADIVQGKAIVKLSAYVNSGMITIHVIQAGHLRSDWSSTCSSHVKISLAPDNDQRTLCNTETLENTNHPVFNEKFSFELLEEDQQKRLFISVWHSDPVTRASEFIGCMSFGIKNIYTRKRKVNGWYYLLNEDIGRFKHLQAVPRKQTSKQEDTSIWDKENISPHSSTSSLQQPLDEFQRHLQVISDLRHYEPHAKDYQAESVCCSQTFDYHDHRRDFTSELVYNTIRQCADKMFTATPFNSMPPNVALPDTHRTRTANATSLKSQFCTKYESTTLKRKPSFSHAVKVAKRRKLSSIADQQDDGTGSKQARRLPRKNSLRQFVNKLRRKWQR